MSKPNHLLCGLLLATVVLACDSVDLTIGVSPGVSGTLEVINANTTPWADAQLLVEAVERDNSRTLCAEKAMATWPPGEAVSVPACGDKIRFTITTGGATARFSYANGQLFRLFGRKEVPVAP